MTNDFYKNLPVFTDFSGFVDFDAYVDVPDDWVVMICDVIGSTKAIRAGRYKDVNMVGAASITAILNACGKTQVPFVFGGDGGTAIIPPDLQSATARALCALKAKSGEIFGLELRVGAIPVRDLRDKGYNLRIRKYELSKGNYLAMFSGEAMERADALLKDDCADNPYLLQPDNDTGDPDLEGLSCRWEPLQATSGQMLTLMVRPTQSEGESQIQAQKDILCGLEKCLGSSSLAAAPVSKNALRFRWPPRGLLVEARALGAKTGYLSALGKAVFTSLVQGFCEITGKKIGGYDGKSYRSELKTNTDFRKFDGILRLVLDVDSRQLADIKDYLEKEYSNGHLVYGLHVADTALMTCLVFNLEQSEHVHFIDGSDGGFALAAVGFKEQLAKRSQDKTSA